MDGLIVPGEGQSPGRSRAKEDGMANTSENPADDAGGRPCRPECGLPVVRAWRHSGNHCSPLEDRPGPGRVHLRGGPLDGAHLESGSGSGPGGTRRGIRLIAFGVTAPVGLALYVPEPGRTDSLVWQGDLP
jgi:hypothetical protein